jgi:ketosteroid isomerase-like protein
MKRLAALFALLLLCAGLAAAKDQKTGPDPKQTEEVRSTELAFAASAKAKDAAKAVTFFDDDIRFFQQGTMLTGIEEEKKNWNGMLSNPNLTIEWHPEVVEAMGGLGYTTGPFEIHIKQADGSVTFLHGRYLTIWRKKPDGSWKAAVDIGNQAPAEKIPAPEKK